MCVLTPKGRQSFSVRWIHWIIFVVWILHLLYLFRTMLSIDAILYFSLNPHYAIVFRFQHTNFKKKQRKHRLKVKKRTVMFGSQNVITSTKLKWKPTSSCRNAHLMFRWLHSSTNNLNLRTRGIHRRCVTHSVFVQYGEKNEIFINRVFFFVASATKFH